jgi:hypothetical protein
MRFIPFHISRAALFERGFVIDRYQFDAEGSQ